jgi:transcriptional regulator with PAS, ATPase and Fis domain
MKFNWIKEFPAAITICDKKGTIIGMNNKSCKTFEKDGGRELIGKNLFDCHPEPSKTTLINLMESKTANSYTIEKNGIKKLIHQSPWYEDGQFMGLVEISMEIPFEMPHFVRKNS